MRYAIEVDPDTFSPAAKVLADPELRSRAQWVCVEKTIALLREIEEELAVYAAVGGDAKERRRGIISILEAVNRGDGSVAEAFSGETRFTVELRPKDEEGAA